MKNYYVECEVKYTDNSEEIPFNGSESFDYIIQSHFKNNAEKAAIIQAKEQFIEEFDDGFTNITVEVVQSYETSDDARTS